MATTELATTELEHPVSVKPGERRARQSRPVVSSARPTNRNHPAQTAVTPKTEKSVGRQRTEEASTGRQTRTESPQTRRERIRSPARTKSRSSSARAKNRRKPSRGGPRIEELLVILGFVVAIIMLVIFSCDLILGWPMRQTSMLLDVSALLCGAALVYLSWDTYKDLR